MRAKVTTEFSGRPDNEALSRRIAAGEIITGDLAQVAVDNKWAKEVGDENEAAEPKALDDMTAKELKAYAAEHNIDLGDASKKDDIRAAIDLAIEG